jgi:hypothetical protein
VLSTTAVNPPSGIGGLSGTTALREIAAENWACLGGDLPVPLTVDEAIERQHELYADIEIAAQHDGRYWQACRRCRLWRKRSAGPS